MVNYNDIADVLESVANYVDEIEYEKQASETEARESRINKIAENYESATGEEVPAQIKSKLAGLDQDTLDHLLKVAQNNSDDTVTSLGGPSESTNRSAPTTVKEAAAHAEERFLGWILD